MLTIPINNVGELGIITDRRPHELPLNAWTDGRNVAFRDDYAEKFAGDTLYTTPSIAPYCLFPVATSAAFYWLILGLAKAYAFDGSVHTDITRFTGGDYAATADLNWTGGILNGIPVVNNGYDVPQMWLPPGVSTRLQALTAWPASTTCRTLRPFKSFLVAGDITKSGTRYQQLVKWSHPADTGSVPSSWDETDPTKDAGEYALAETSGSIVDFVTLRDLNIVYKDDAVYKMQYIGGAYIFKFSELTKLIGILSRRCAVEFQPGHQLFLGYGDILRHDGQQAVSVLDSRMRKFLHQNLDPTYFPRSFVVVNYARSEVWCCFPANGNQFPSMAIVWSWRTGVTTIRELPSVAHIAVGPIVSSSDAWDSAVGVWDTDYSVWDILTYNPAIKNLMGVLPDAMQLRTQDVTNTWNGSSMTAYVERTGLGFPLKAGAPPDFTTMKFCSSIWPRIEGTDGGIVSVTVGTQNHIDAPVTWGASQAYVIGSTQKIDVSVSGRLLAVRFSSTSDIDWRLHGYELDIVPDGGF